MRVFLGTLFVLLAIPAFCMLAFWAGGGRQTAQAEFHVAAMNGDVAQMGKAIDRGLSVDARDQEGDTPMMCAATFGKAPAVGLLLQHGADVNATNHRGWTALAFAASRGDDATVELLIKAGANLNTASREGRTPLMRAAAAGRTSVVKLLLAHGARKNLTDAEGRTALTLARRAGNRDCAAALKPSERQRLASAPGFSPRCRPWAWQGWRPSHAKSS